MEIRNKGFPFHASFADFNNKYNVIMTEAAVAVDPHQDTVEVTRRILQHIKDSSSVVPSDDGHRVGTSQLLYKGPWCVLPRVLVHGGAVWSHSHRSWCTIVPRGDRPCRHPSRVSHRHRVLETMRNAAQKRVNLRDTITKLVDLTDKLTDTQEDTLSNAVRAPLALLAVFAPPRP